MAINPPDQFYNVLDNSIEIEAGTEVSIRLELLELVTGDDVGIDVDIEQRKCRMPSEVPEDMKLFKTYSRSGCMYNCMYEYR